MCQSQWRVAALRCLYDRGSLVVSRMHNSRDRKHEDFSASAVGDPVLKNDRSFVSPRSANSVHESWLRAGRNSRARGRDNTTDCSNFTRVTYALASPRLAHVPSV